MFGVVTALVIGTEKFAEAYRNDCSEKPAEGHYCKNAGNKPECPPGCYCPGGDKRAVGSDINETQNCSNKTSTVESSLKNSSVFYCPKDFPKSLKGAKDISECYNDTISDHKIYSNWDYHCDKGQYLQKGTIKCVDCENCTGDKCYYCPGVTAIYSSAEDQGLLVCPKDTKPNKNKDACTATEGDCPIGSYMPKYSQDCDECPSGYVCFGGTYTFGYPRDQGLLLPKDACVKPYFKDNDSFIANSYGDGCDECPIGTKANADHTECVETSIKVTKGYYLPANSVQQQKCSNPKKFCPGGNFWKSSVDQGQYDCPFTGTSASSNYQRCTVTLSSEQLKFGVLGNNGSQCWSKTDPEDFQYCVLGLRGIQTMDIKGLRDTIQQNIRNNGLQTAVFIGNQQTN